MPHNQIFNSMVEFFEEDAWEFNWMDGLPVLSLGFSGQNGKWTCYAQAREEQEQFVFYSVCPLNAPEDKRQAIAEFITRANYGMIIGNFEMDFDDGEIRYKTSVDVEGATLLAPIVKQLVYANVLIMDRYLPGLMAVIYSDIDPQEEIERLEASFNATDDEDYEDDEDEDFDDDSDDEDFGDNPLDYTNGTHPT